MSDRQAREGAWGALPLWLQPRYLYPLYAFAWLALIEVFRLIGHWNPHGLAMLLLGCSFAFAVFTVAMLPWLIRDMYIGNISAALASSDPTRQDDEDPTLFGLDLSSAWFAIFPQWLLTRLIARSRKSKYPLQIAEVEIVVIQQEAVTGRDYGTIFIENGNLKFRGLRTNFSLRTDSIRYHDRQFKDLFGKYEVARLAGSDMSVGFRQYTRRIGKGRRPYTNLLAGWTSRAEASTEPALLPPSEFLPEARVRAYVVAFYVALLVFVLDTGIERWIHRGQPTSHYMASDFIATIGSLQFAVSAIWYSARQWRLQNKLLRQNDEMAP